MGGVRRSLAVAVGLAAAVLGYGGAASSMAASMNSSWTRFGYDAARTNHSPRGLAPAQVARLHEKRVSLPGTVDSSPIYLSGVRVGGHRRSVLVMTTSYGRTLALAPATGATLWRFTPPSYGSLAGSAQITNATPVASGDAQFVYAASPDGLIHKVRVSDGREVRSGHWPVSVTRDPAHEKLGTALNLAGRYVLVTTGRYIGDAPPYQGKVVAIRRTDGGIAHVFNSLCSQQRRIIDPSSCPAQRSAIWGRAGAVVEPKTHRVFVTTGNGPFDGHTSWGDSVLELSPGAARLRRHYTPGNVRELEGTDRDLGSTAPALLPPPHRGGHRFLLQGGKDGKLRLLKLPRSLPRVGGQAGRRLGGEVQTLPMPGGQDMFTAPAVLHRRGSTLVFVATTGATVAYRLRGGRLHTVWQADGAGTSPVIAGKLLWVYDRAGALAVYRAASGKLVRELPAPSGHWNSPIVAGGGAFLPSGNANDHATTGTLSIYRPG